MTGTSGWWQDTRARLARRGAWKWYAGSLWGLLYLAIPVIIVWSVGDPAPAAALTTGFVVLIAAAYVVTPPLLWGRQMVTVALTLVAFGAFTSIGFALIGVNAVYFWIYPPIMASFTWRSRRFMLSTLGITVAAQVVVILATGSFFEVWYAPAITLSVGFMMYAFARQITTITQLREAQAEIARLAIVDERERFARDMHDVLGHSLTVVTVKAELAHKLVHRDPDRAETEIEDIERLSRSALADLRAAVAGYREMGLPTELSAASAALVAAEITPHLPTDSEVVEPALRELFAWVLRESVTNIIRHSGAHNCWVALEPARIAIGDDGRGGVQLGGAGGDALSGDAGGPGLGQPGLGGVRAESPGSDGAPSGGSGLAGLAVRATKAGARLIVRPGEDGGTLVVAERLRT